MERQSTYPGKKGRTIISMHRDTHGRFLKNLKEGDLISLKTKEGSNLVYKIYAFAIVDASKIKLRMDTPESELILYSCYPFNAVNTGGPMRYVVQAILTNQLKGELYAKK